MDHEPSQVPASEAVRGGTAGVHTGNAAVDAVLARLDELEDRPVAEHVAVFEAAHEQLRAALADAGDRSAG